MKIIHLGKTEIDWETYLKVAKQSLSRSITKKLDDSGKEITTPSSYLFTLAAIGDEEINYSSLMSNPGCTLRHLFYSFILISPLDCVMSVMKHTTLAVLTSPCRSNLEISILSGNLEQWRESIINGCSEVADSNLRAILDQCLIYFDGEGLGKIWSDYNRINSPIDNTIKLIEKR